MDEVLRHIETVSHNFTEIKRLFEFGKMIHCPEKCAGFCPLGKWLLEIEEEIFKKNSVCWRSTLELYTHLK